MPALDADIYISLVVRDSDMTLCAKPTKLCVRWSPCRHFYSLIFRRLLRTDPPRKPLRPSPTSSIPLLPLTAELIPPLLDIPVGLGRSGRSSSGGNSSSRNSSNKGFPPDLAHHMGGRGWPGDIRSSSNIIMRNTSASKRGTACTSPTRRSSRLTTISSSSNRRGSRCSNSVVSMTCYEHAFSDVHKYHEDSSC